MSHFAKVFRDPLVHFLAVGAVFFAFASAINPPPADGKTIVVDRAALMEFIQFRSKAFEPKAAAALLDSLSAADRAALIDDFVREEVLYRESKALNLDQDDYVIKQRLVQKFEFATDAAIGDDALSDGEVEAWYAAHKSDYALAPTATFTHVFFDAGKRGSDEARAEAANAADRLNATRAPFEASVGKGDRFPFQTNHIDRGFDAIASEFGEAAARAIFDANGRFGEWRGPVISPYGAHAVFVKSFAAARTPPFAEIRDRVVEDAARARRQKTRAAIVDGAIKQYKVVVTPAQSAPAAGR